MIREETWDIDTLHPHPRNYNAHPGVQIERIAQSLLTFGQLKRIVIRSDGTILAGHGVWQSAQYAGYDRINVAIVPDEWTDERAIAYLVADNETRRGVEPDNTILAELVELVQQEVNCSAIGFDDASIQELLDSLVMPNGNDWGEALGDLPKGDRAPFQQMTFTLSDDQAEVVKEALARAKNAGVFVETGNENSNGNALARIAEAYLGS